MDSHSASAWWIPLERVQGFIQPEPALVVLGLAVGAWLFYSIFLRAISKERHETMRRLFRNLLGHVVATAMLCGAFVALTQFFEGSDATPYGRMASYVGLLTIFEGAVVITKLWRILIFEYLFFGHMKVSVPVLLVNIFTLVFSVFLAGWLLSDLFSVRLAPLLATSAVFSLVLGLALQDTLGNLFAGVALQIDKPYELGDWIEVNNSGQKWVGQVFEITWRATTFISMTEERITIPNRIMSQSEISNFATQTHPFIRSQVFRLSYGADIEKAKKALALAALAVPEVKKKPMPFSMVSEAAESWISVKVVYYLDDYGRQYLIADQVLAAGLSALAKEGIRMASPRIEVLSAAQS